MRLMKIWSALTSAAMIALVSAGLGAAPASESMVVWPDKVDVTVPDAVTMKFDLSRIPAGSVIQYATLNMDLAQSDGRGDSYSLSAHKITAIDSTNHATISTSYDTQSVSD